MYRTVSIHAWKKKEPSDGGDGWYRTTQKLCICLLKYPRFCVTACAGRPISSYDDGPTLIVINSSAARTITTTALTAASILRCPFGKIEMYSGEVMTAILKWAYY